MKNMKKKIYVVLRKDRYVIVTDRLKDAKRAFNAKYLGCLRRYGNVTELFPSKSLNEKIEQFAGIYKLDEFRDVLKKIYKTSRTVRNYYEHILELSVEIEREPIRRKEEVPPVRFFQFLTDEDDLLKYIIRYKSIRYIRFKDEDGDSIYIAEYKNYYGLYLSNEGLYISFKKNSTVDEIVNYVIDNIDDLNFGNKFKYYLMDIPPIPCEEIPNEETNTDKNKNMCFEVRKRVGGLKTIIYLMGK